MNFNWNAFIIPIGAFVVAIVAIVSGGVGEAHKQRLRAEQRMSMVARGMNSAEIDKLLGGVDEDPKPPKDPLRSLGYARRTAISASSAGIGIALFGLMMVWIFGERDLLVVAAAGLIPLMVGIGFFVDYELQKRELSRFGLEIDPGR